MMSFALKYREPIDAITADKALKMRRYELDDDEWKVIKDLVDILEVCFSHCALSSIQFDTDYNILTAI